MLSNTKIDKKEKIRQLCGSLGLWTLTAATLFSSSDVERRPAAVMNMSPAYAITDPTSNIWNRNDNENETVHLTADFDSGVRVAPVPGRK